MKRLLLFNPTDYAVLLCFFMHQGLCDIITDNTPRKNHAKLLQIQIIYPKKLLIEQAIQDLI